MKCMRTLMLTAALFVLAAAAAPPETPGAPEPAAGSPGTISPAPSPEPSPAAPLVRCEPAPDRLCRSTKRRRIRRSPRFASNSPASSNGATPPLFSGSSIRRSGRRSARAAGAMTSARGGSLTPATARSGRSSRRSSPTAARSAARVSRNRSGRHTSFPPGPRRRTPSPTSPPSVPASRSASEEAQTLRSPRRSTGGSSSSCWVRDGAGGSVVPGPPAERTRRMGRCEPGADAARLARGVREEGWTVDDEYSGRGGLTPRPCTRPRPRPDFPHDSPELDEKARARARARARETTARVRAMNDQRSTKTARPRGRAVR